MSALPPFDHGKTLSGNVIHRPAFTSTAKKIRLSFGEDRRHLLHWDEHLLPLLNSTLDRVWTDCNGEPARYRVSLLAKVREFVRRKIPDEIPMEDLELLIATQLNSAVSNLVPGDADANKAIEHMRARVRAATAFLAKHCDDNNDDSWAGRREQMMTQVSDIIWIDTLERTDSNDTGIMRAQSEIADSIHFELFGNRHDSPDVGMHSPRHMIELLHDIAHSLTFDLSSKAKRDQVSFTLQWYKKMQGSRAQFTSGTQMLGELLSLTRAAPSSDTTMALMGAMSDSSPSSSPSPASTQRRRSFSKTAAKMDLND